MAATAQNPEQAPVSAPWVWNSADIASSDDWIYRISPDVLAEINQAVADVKQRGIAFETVTRADFPLPGLEADCAAMRRDLHVGRGFCLIKGVPVEGYRIWVDPVLGEDNPVDLGHVSADMRVCQRLYRKAGKCDLILSLGQALFLQHADNLAVLHQAGR